MCVIKISLDLFNYNVLVKRFDCGQCYADDNKVYYIK